MYNTNPTLAVVSAKACGHCKEIPENKLTMELKNKITADIGKTLKNYLGKKFFTKCTFLHTVTLFTNS